MPLPRRTIFFKYLRPRTRSIFLFLFLSHLSWYFIRWGPANVIRVERPTDISAGHARCSFSIDRSTQWIINFSCVRLKFLLARSRQMDRPFFFYSKLLCPIEQKCNFIGIGIIYNAYRQKTFKLENEPFMPGFQHKTISYAT